jgi:mercuric ion binding protein
MKKILWMTMIVNCFFLLSRAQQPVRKGALETATISVPTVQCEQCKDRIERYISREDGIQMVKVDYKHHTCKVTYIWDRTTIENIKTAIANIGYDADDVAADPEAYKKLPTCCKKPEDGGGHQKN